jgi:hypothetical protein
VKRNGIYYFRRAEIITIARRKEVPDTDDLDRFLKAWFWHRPTSADKDPIGSLRADECLRSCSRDHRNDRFWTHKRHRPN